MCILGRLEPSNGKQAIASATGAILRVFGKELEDRPFAILTGSFDPRVAEVKFDDTVDASGEVRLYVAVDPAKLPVASSYRLRFARNFESGEMFRRHCCVVSCDQDREYVSEARCCVTSGGVPALVGAAFDLVPKNKGVFQWPL